MLRQIYTRIPRYILEFILVGTRVESGVRMTTAEEHGLSTLRRYDVDYGGVGAIGFALTALLAVGIIAGIVEYLHVSDVSAKMRNAASAAALSGAIGAQNRASGGTAAADRAVGAEIAEMSLRFGAETVAGVGLIENESTVTVSTTTVDSTLTWRAEIATDLTKLFGLRGYSIAGTATATRPLGSRPMTTSTPRSQLSLPTRFSTDLAP